MPSRSDADRLEVLLLREQRLLSMYEAGLRRGAIEAGLGETLRDHEREHVRALEQALEPARRNPRASVPPVGLPGQFSRPEVFARAAMALEARAVTLFPDALAAVEDPQLRQPLGSIMACGSAHVVALRDLLGRFLVN